MTPGGATDADLSTLRSRVWAEAGDEMGARVAAVLDSGEGYRAAAPRSAPWSCSCTTLERVR